MTGRRTYHSAGDTLTVREAQVMDRVVLGLTDQEIAAALFISISTVKTHMGVVFAKLGAHNRTLAAVLYDRQQRGA